MNAFHCIGTATVTSTKETNTAEIFCYSALLHPTAEGAVSLEVKQTENKAVDSDNKPINASVLKSNKSIPATWIALGEPNRLTPPDVREGSIVALYQVVGGTDYYWTTFGFAAETMRLETVIYGWNADPSIDKDSTFDISRYYQFTISTRDGIVSFRNSNVNGEATILDLTFNYMMGHMALSGAHQNQLIFDDVENSLTYTNADQSTFTINKTNALIETKEGIYLTAEESIQLKTKALHIETETTTIIANSTEWHSPTTTHYGDFNVVGGITASEGVTAEGVIQGKGGVKTGQHDMDNHVHGNGNDGNDTTGPKG